MWLEGNQDRAPKDNINEELANLKGFIEEDKAKILLYRFLRENPTFAVDLMMGVKLFPFQHILLKSILNSDYSMLVCARGLGKSLLAGIAASLLGIYNQGYKIGILAQSFRAARNVITKVEEIAAKPEAQLFANCIGQVKKGNDQWNMPIGSSQIIALPLGASGEKLRGFRFNVLIVDEFLLFNEKVFTEVISPFLVVRSEKEIALRRKVKELNIKSIKETGIRFTENKLIVLSSASYKFEYLYKLYENWYNAILNGGDGEEEKTKFIAQLSYENIPPEMYDVKKVESDRKSMSSSAFAREYGAQFSDDSSGFFSILKMENCTKKIGDYPCIEVKGDSKSKYILSFDPSWSDGESSDDFAIHVFKLNEEEKTGILVHSYAMSGTSMKDHIHYFTYLLNNFNIVFICGDYNGALQFISAANESGEWKKNNIQIGIIDAPLNDPEKYNEDISLLKRQYDEKINKCYLRTPAPQWIREANQALQNAFEKQKIWFGSKAVGCSSYDDQMEICPNIDDLNFQTLNKGEEESKGEARKGDFIENQGVLIDLTKTECAMIQLTTSSQGGQRFDLPMELKKQKGPDRPRKDSYSALVLGNYAIKLYFDMVSQEAVSDDFIPFLI